MSKFDLLRKYSPYLLQEYVPIIFCNHCPVPKLKVELVLIVYNKQENEQTITQYRDLTSKVKNPKK